MVILDIHIVRATIRLSQTEKMVHTWAYEIHDPNQSKDTLFFLHGWPDSIRIYRDYVDALAPQYRCVLLVLPGYPLPSDFTGTVSTSDPFPKQFTIDQALETLKETIEMTHIGTITLVCHDWGAILSYLFQQRYPEGVDRMVIFSLGITQRTPNACTLAYVAMYQCFLCLAYLCRDARCTRFTARTIAGQPNVAEDGGEAIPPMVSRMNWPYYALFRDVLFCRGTVSRFNAFKPSPNVPILFFYELHMPVHKQATDKGWNQLVERTCPHSKVVPIDGDHWMVYTKRKTILPILEEWLEVTPPRM
jgi:pimeloyl-ACP methyl ester carboxylesterase